VELFAESAADLFSNVTKPLLDVCIYVHSLARRVDPLAPYSMIAYLLTSGVALTAMRKPTGAYTAAVQHQVLTSKYDLNCYYQQRYTCCVHMLSDDLY
jgi:ABC transporter transmembrane region 2